MSADKPTAYLDSNIPSALHYDGGNTLLLRRKGATCDWWRLERHLFHLWTSKTALLELAEGHYGGQAHAVAEAYRLPHLSSTAAVKHCASQLIRERLVPASEERDALHLAFCIVHRIDYLLTWNQAHLDNLEVKSRLAVVCKRERWRAPWIVSPDTILKAVLEQTIRRKNEDQAF
ncbi:MAG: hypothetical protein ABSE73_15410 [Planctomycetota bacterium]